MSCNSDNIDEIKRKLRNFKKLEIKIRTGNSFYSGNLAGKPLKMVLMWDEFFDLHGAGNSKGRYSIEDIASMSREEFKNIVNEFFSEYITNIIWKMDLLTFIFTILKFLSGWIFR